MTLAAGVRKYWLGEFSLKCDLIKWHYWRIIELLFACSVYYNPLYSRNTVCSSKDTQHKLTWFFLPSNKKDTLSPHRCAHLEATQRYHTSSAEMRLCKHFTTCLIAWVHRILVRRCSRSLNLFSVSFCCDLILIACSFSCYLLARW